jgi:hypothetical protein
MAVFGIGDTEDSRRIMKQERASLTVDPAKRQS